MLSCNLFNSVKFNFFCFFLSVRKVFCNIAAEKDRGDLQSSLSFNCISMIDKKKIQDLALEWLQGKEYFLVAAEVNNENKITVEIDHKDGVWIEDCCELSKFIEGR